MIRARAITAALLLLLSIEPAAGATAPAAEPFQEIPLVSPPGRAYGWAYASMALGATLIGASFELSNRANRAYDDYQVAVSAPEIARLYDRTTHYDHWSSATLLSGEVLIAGGLYWRFLRRPRASSLSFDLSATRCSADWHF